MPHDYDKEAIDSARKSGLFDSDFDPMVLELSDDEKRSMAKGLGTAAASLAPGESRGQGRPRRKKKEQGPEQPKPGFLQRFLRWLVMLFTGINQEEYELRARMKQLYRELARVRPQVYNAARKTVLPALAYQIHALYSQISGFSKPFAGIFDLAGSSASIDYHLFFLKHVSYNPAVGGVNDFSEPAIAMRASEEREAAVRKEYENLIHEFLGSFDEEEKRRLDKIYNEVLVFQDLMEFRYTRMLQLFGWDPESAADKPAFAEADGVNIVDGLKELEKLLLSLNLKYLPEVLGMGIAFFRAELMPGMDPAEGEALNAHYAKLEAEHHAPLIAAVSRLLKDRKLTLLISCISRNPDYEAHVFPGSLHFFADLSRDLALEVDRRIKEVYKKKSRNEIDQKLVQLFGSSELHNPYTYSEAINIHLDKFELPLFLYPLALVLSLRFLKDKYYHLHKRTINKLLVNGSFRNSLTRRMLADEFYRIDEISEELQNFTAFVDPRTDKGGQLVNMINNYNGDMPSKKALSNRIAEINHALHGVLKKVQSSIHNLQIALSQICRDIRSPHPETIDNLAQISTPNNKKFIADLTTAENESELFCGILSRVFVTSLKE